MKQCLDVLGDIARHQRSTHLVGLERRHLLVQRANANALLVIQHRAVDGAGDVVFGEFRRGAHVDNLVKLIELC